MVVIKKDKALMAYKEDIEHRGIDYNMKGDEKWW